MRKIYEFFTIAVIVFFSQNKQAFGQIDQNASDAWSVSLLLSTQLESENDEQLSDLGFEIKYLFPDKRKIRFFLNANYREWQEYDIRLLAVHLGVAYPLTSNHAFTLSTGVGPQAVIGNDYALIAAGLFSRAEYNFPLGEQTFLVIGGGYNISSLFHPGQFSYLDYTVGVRF